MGFNSSVIVLNDALYEIGKDKDFGKKLETAILEVDYGRSRGNNGKEISSGNCFGAATVIETHHADQLSVVSFGGNCGNVLTKPSVWGYSLNTGTPDDNVAILKAVADQLGYNIVRQRNA